MADGEVTERSSMVLLGSDGLITTILGVVGIGIFAVLVSLFVKLCNTNGNIWIFKTAYSSVDGFCGSSNSLLFDDTEFERVEILFRGLESVSPSDERSASLSVSHNKSTVEEIKNFKIINSDVTGFFRVDYTVWRSVGAEPLFFVDGGVLF